MLSALAVTTYEAAVGWVIGTLLAFMSGVVTVFIRTMRPGLLQLAVVVNSIPVIALGPVLISIFPREVAPMALAAISVYFTTLVAITTGFAATKAAHEDLFTVLGAGTGERFRRLQLPTALPLIVDGLKLAVPAAVLGAILGEWFGSPGARTDPGRDHAGRRLPAPVGDRAHRRGPLPDRLRAPGPAPPRRQGALWLAPTPHAPPGSRPVARTSLGGRAPGRGLAAMGVGVPDRPPGHAGAPGRLH